MGNVLVWGDDMENGYKVLICHWVCMPSFPCILRGLRRLSKQIRNKKRVFLDPKPVTATMALSGFTLRVLFTICCGISYLLYGYDQGREDYVIIYFLMLQATN